MRIVRTLKLFQCTHILGASRGLLCDSSAVLFSQGRIQDLSRGTMASVERYQGLWRSPEGFFGAFRGGGDKAPEAESLLSTFIKRSAKCDDLIDIWPPYLRKAVSCSRDDQSQLLVSWGGERQGRLASAPCSPYF